MARGPGGHDVSEMVRFHSRSAAANEPALARA
jgi:hypothetical protein